MSRPRSSIVLATSIFAGGLGFAAWQRRPDATLERRPLRSAKYSTASPGETLTLHVSSQASTASPLVSGSREVKPQEDSQLVAAEPVRQPDPPAPVLVGDPYAGIDDAAKPMRIPNEPVPAAVGPRVSQSADELGAGRLRFHRLVDGDDLPVLAERYLGDPSRASEILALNGDVISQPDLLPLGKVIRIPPLGSKPAEAEEEAPRSNTLLAPIR